MSRATAEPVARLPAVGPDAGVAGPAGRLASLRMVHLLGLALTLLFAGQLARVPLLMAGQKDAPLLVNDVLVIAVFGATLLLAARERTLRVDRTGMLALAFAASAGISTALAIPRFGLSIGEFVFSSGYLARWLVYFGLYLAVINFVSRAEVFRLVGAWRTGMVVFAGFGILQAIFLPDFAQRVFPQAELYYDWDPQGHRLVSTFLDPNYAGAFLAMGLLVLLALLTFGAQIPRWQVVVLFVGLALTLSRGAAVAFLAGACVIVVGRGLSRTLLRLLAAGAVVGMALLPWVLEYAIRYNKLFLDASALTRIAGWLRAIELFLEYPVLGVGFNTLGFVVHRMSEDRIARASFGLDGGPLLIAALTGIVGVTLYCATFGSALWRCRQVWRNPLLAPAERGLALGTAAATVAILVQSVFLNTLLYPFLLVPLWVSWGLVFIVRAPAREAQGVAPSTSPAIVSLPG